MGEQIEFPKNYSMYMSRVMTFLREGNVEKAIVYMQKAYAIKEAESLNILLASSLLQTGQYREALELAEEKKEFYETDEKRLLIYLEILIENNQILQAENYIKQALSNESIKYRDSWDRLAEKLDQLKHQQEENKRKAEEQTMKNLFSLASLNTMEQFSKIQEIYTLPNDKLEGVAPYLFTNPYVHPVVRATLFSLLAERNIDEDYKYLWFGETKEINPRKTTSIEMNETMTALMNVMDEELVQNPSLYQLVKNEIDALFLMLYPFENNVIKKEEAKAWVEAVIASIEPDYLHSDTTELKDLENINNWISKTHKQMLGFE